MVLLGMLGIGNLDQDHCCQGEVTRKEAQAIYSANHAFAAMTCDRSARKRRGVVREEKERGRPRETKRAGWAMGTLQQGEG